jgi:peptidoglycan/LPS O-acetylase OafA/YrhL
MAYKNNINALQILRGIAACLVCVWHSRLSIKYSPYDYWPDGDAAFRAEHFPSVLNHLDFGVDIFFCVSGFIMCLLISKVKSDRHEAIRFTLRRIARIYPPYWFFTLAVVFVFVLSKGKFNVGHLTGGMDTDGLRLLTSAFLIPQQDAPILGVGWTLVHEQLFYAICAISILVGLNGRLIEVLVSASLVAILLALLNYELWWGYLFSPFVIEFLFGAMAFKFSNVTTRPGLFIVISIAVYACGSSVLDRFVVSTPPTVLVRAMFGGLVGFLLITGMIGLDAKIRFSLSKPGQLFMRIGDASYSLYLMHWFILSGLGKLVPLIPASYLNTGSTALWQFSSVLVAILMAVLFAERVELPFHDFLLQRLQAIGQVFPQARDDATGAAPRLDR